jgi:2-polyprenyl-3-methyl-5-hydroxy-6-metoxy-1,4-benzoquinol methylase
MSASCLICGNPTETVSPSYAGFQAPSTFRIQSCPTCEVSYSLPRVDASAVYDNIYRNASSIPGYSRYWQFMSEIKASKDPLDYLSKAEDVYWGVATAIAKLGLDKTTAKCLEIGSGLGYTTFAFASAGYDIKGLDLSAVAVENAKRMFGDHYVSGDLFEYSKQHSNQFDVVVLTEVIEHVDDPLAFLEAIKLLLKPSGKLVLTTPNKSFFPAKVVWVSTPPPVHCYWFSEKTMAWFADKLQASVEFVDFSAYYGEGRDINIATPLDYVMIGPILDEKGELVSSRKLKNFARKIPFAMSLYRKFTQGAQAKELLRCGKRCPAMCAVLTMHKS